MTPPWHPDDELAGRSTADWDRAEADLSALVQARARRYALGVPVVRIGLLATEGEELSELLLEWQPDVQEQVCLQLWLLTVLTCQRRHVPNAERSAYDAKANRILEMLDPEPGE